jgi:hypothetical protein
MNLAQILKTLPPGVYLRSGELVIPFSTPDDLVARVSETQATLSALERLELARYDGRSRTINGHSTSHGESTGVTEVENYAGPAAKTSEGKED